MYSVPPSVNGGLSVYCSVYLFYFLLLYPDRNSKSYLQSSLSCEASLHTTMKIVNFIMVFHKLEKNIVNIMCYDLYKT